MENRKFKFRVVDLAGHQVNGIMEGSSQEKVAGLLRQQGYFIVKPPIPVKSRLSLLTKRRRQIDLLSLTVFAKKLNDLLRGGVSLIAALKVVTMEKNNKVLTTGVTEVLASLEQGKTFGAAAREAGIFPRFFLQALEVGELSGSLPESLSLLTKFYHSQHRLKQQLKKALFYPAVVGTGAMLVLTAFIIFVLPETNKMLLRQGAELPLLTKFLLGITSKQALVVAGSTGGLALLVSWALRFTGPGQTWLSSLSWRLPGVSRAYQTFHYLNLSKSLGLLLTSGISLLDALATARKTSSVYLLQEKLHQVEDSIARGNTLTGSLTQARVFTVTERELIRVGEEAGELGEIFHYLARYYEEQLEDYLSKFTGYLEPFLVLALTIVVAIVVGGILQPLYELAAWK